MEVTFFGVRGSCPCSGDRYRRYGGNTSCVLVQMGEGESLILDLGTGLRALGEHLEPGLLAEGMPLRASALLTHLHYDHILGLPYFGPLHDPGAVLTVYGPQQNDGPLQEKLPHAVTPPFFPVELTEFRGEVVFHDTWNEDFAVGTAKVRARAVPHPGNTLGFRIEADGKVLAYLPDHQAPLDRRTVTEGVLELCEGADLLIHDAQYSDEEFADRPHWGHSTVPFAVHVAVESGARQLALFHHDPAHGDKAVDALLARGRRLSEARALEEVWAAKEGVVFDMGADVSAPADHDDAGTSPIDGDRFKEVLGHFATGITIVTAMEEGVPVGFTCQAFSALSLSPPMVALAPAKSSTSWPRIARAGAFCVNVLAAHQEAVCRAFAVSGGDKFAGTAWHPGANGAPVLAGSLAVIECALGSIHDAGDHELVTGHVQSMRLGDGAPLLYYRGAYAHLAG